MEHDLLEIFRKENEELFLNGHISADDYFDSDYLNSYMAELFIINLN